MHPLGMYWAYDLQGVRETLMARTVIRNGVIRRVSEQMKMGRAAAFAKMLRAKNRECDVAVTRVSGSMATVEFRPGPAQATRLVLEEQAKRAERVEGVRRYKWRSYRPGVWEATKPDSTKYTIRLRAGTCDCIDSDKLIGTGIKCKHLLCAQEAEERMQAHLRQ
jgi:hypothetical protein